MIGSRYLIRHDAIVVPDFHYFMKSPHIGRGLFELFRSARRDEGRRDVGLKKLTDTLPLKPEFGSSWWITLLVSSHEQVDFYQACIDGLDEAQLAGHKRLGGYLDPTYDALARKQYDIFMDKLAKNDRVGFSARIKFELESYIGDWERTVSWAEADEPGERPYFPPLENCYEEGIYEVSYSRDTLGYAISGFLRLAESGLIDGTLLEPFLVRLEAIDERYRRVLGDRRDVRTPEYPGSFDFYPAEFWWHHPV